MAFEDDLKNIIDKGKEIKSTFDDYYAFAAGQLTKLTIRAYDDIEANKEVKDSPFELMINPSSITRQVSVITQSAQSLGSNQSPPKYINTNPGIISFDFVLDGTGVVNNNGVLSKYTKRSVDKQIEVFLNVVHMSKRDYGTTTHSQSPCAKEQQETKKKIRPNFLRINYGSFDWTCVLDSVSITYNLFNSQGKALRAKVSCSFTMYNLTKDERKKLPKVASGIIENFTPDKNDDIPVLKKMEDFGRITMEQNFNALR